MDLNQEIELLFVEDSAHDAELTIRALKKNNFVNNLVHLQDGAEALDFIFGTGEYGGRNINQVPKLILLDLRMPKVNGLQVLEKIKLDPRTKTIPVVILTSSAEDPDIRKSYALGANSFIIKPVDFGNFSKIVTELGLYWMVINKDSR